MDTVRPAPKQFGPFEVLARIGRGGTATVYKVRHAPSGKLAALKVAPRIWEFEPGALERFQRECLLMRPLRHPNIVRALGLGEHDGVCFLVQEYVPGQNLDEHVKQHGPLPPARAIALFRQVADGLLYLHEHDVLHRDIKPSNIFVTPDGRAKLGDFGLVKDLKGDPPLTQSRQAMGTLDYGAPEQFEDAKHVDRRCDLFSLAATLYTALTGKFPFGCGNHLRIVQRKLLNQFVPLRLLVPALDPALDRLVSRCLEANPDRRPADCVEFLTALRGCDPRPAAAPAGAGVPDFPTAAAGAERRATVRFAIDLTTTFVPFHQNMRGQWQASVLDVSPAGVCLQTSRPVAVHSVLQVNLVPRGPSELVMVRWVKPGRGETHVAGCSFVRTLSERELEEIRRAGGKK